MLDIQASEAYLAARAARDSCRANADFMGSNAVAVAVRSEANTLHRQRASAVAAAAAASMRTVSPRAASPKASASFTVPQGFVYPAKRTQAEALRDHPNAPSAFRLQEISAPYTDDYERAARAAAEERAQHADGRPAFSTHPDPAPLSHRLGGVFGAADERGFPLSDAEQREFSRSVHLAAGGISSDEQVDTERRGATRVPSDASMRYHLSMQAAAARAREKAEWAAKIAGDSPTLHFNRTSQDATKTGRLAGLLSGPPIKPALRDIHSGKLRLSAHHPMEPLPVSMHATGERRGSWIGCVRTLSVLLPIKRLVCREIHERGSSL
jgi:hypothetical protein